MSPQELGLIGQVKITIIRGPINLKFILILLSLRLRDFLIYFNGNIYKSISVIIENFNRVFGALLSKGRSSPT